MAPSLVWTLLRTGGIVLISASKLVVPCNNESCNRNVGKERCNLNRILNKTHLIEPILKERGSEPARPSEALVTGRRTRKNCLCPLPKKTRYPQPSKTWRDSCQIDMVGGALLERLQWLTLYSHRLPWPCLLSAAYDLSVYTLRQRADCGATGNV
jgi:hypothetical protein